jgi:hypothetical protein
MGNPSAHGLSSNATGIASASQAGTASLYFMASSPLDLLRELLDEDRAAGWPFDEVYDEDCRIASGGSSSWVRTWRDPTIEASFREAYEGSEDRSRASLSREMLIDRGEGASRAELLA